MSDDRIRFRVWDGKAAVERTRPVYMSNGNIPALVARNLVASMKSPLYLLLKKNLPPPKPLTRWERVRRRLEVYRDRVVLARRALRGDDIHEDCW